jgi:sigma-B regulation protein RsbU (phosphoserine phosphatase)
MNDEKPVPSNAQDKLDESLLRRVPLFESLRLEDLKDLAGCLHQIDIAAGAILFCEEDRGDCFYIVLDGQVEIVKAMGTAEERLLAVRGPGDFLGEVSLFEREGLRMASVRARTPVRLSWMTQVDFDKLLHRWPGLAYEMVRQLTNRLREDADDTIRDLREKNRQLAEAYEELKAAQAQIVEKEKLERELAVARRIQESMLPRTLPSLPGYDFGARLLPARAVGGDLFDFIRLDKDNIGIVIGDVSDKGVPAALFMALVRSLIRAEAYRSLLPAEVLRRVNGHLLEMNELGMFITMIYGVLNRTRREFVYARAGHELPLLYDQRGGPIQVGETRGMLMGIFPDILIDEQILSIPPGGTLILYTDGATDAVDKDERRYGLERLGEAVRANQDAPAQVVCSRVLEAIQAYHGKIPQADDITLVVVHAD